MLSLPRFLGGLFVRICPVEYLLFDKLTRGDGAERCSGKIEVCTRTQRHQSFVIHLAGLQLPSRGSVLGENLADLFRTAQGRVFPVIEVLGVPAPRSVVILVQNYAVPSDGLDPLVCGLDAPDGVPPQNILKGGEADERPAFVHTVELTVILLLAELPAFEILVGQKVFFPSGLDSRFESENQQLLPTHPESQLICGEGLAEAHLRIPKEVWDKSPVGRIFPEGVEICGGFLNGSFLLRAHLEVLGSFHHVVLPCHSRRDRLLNFPHTADAPFPFRIGNMILSENVSDKSVIKRGPVLAHSRPLQNYLEFHVTCLILFPHADLCGACGVAHLKPPLVGRIVNMLVGIYGRGRGNPAAK